MAHLSEAFPPPSHTIPSLWPSFWEVDSSQWQWQAPRSQESDPKVPAVPFPWLSGLQEWINRSKETADKHSAETVLSMSTTKPSIFKDISSFRQKLKECNPDELAALCGDFNQHFKHSLTLGLLPESGINAALGGITKDLCHIFPGEAASQRLLFYKATWEGLAACGILGTDQLGNTVIKRVMFFLSQLPVTSEMQELALGIVATLSPGQLQEIAPAIASVAEKLLLHWVQDYSISSRSHCYTTHDQDLDRAASDSNVLQMSTKSVTGSIHKVESSESILNSFPAKLAEVLQYLPPMALRSIIRQGSHCLSQSYKSIQRLPLELRYSWLSLVSQVPNANGRLFLWTWKLMDASGPPLQGDIMSIIILQHWTSQGFLRKAGQVNQKFRHLILEGDGGFANLFALLTERQEKFWLSNQLQLFKMLLEVGQYDTIYSTIYHMKRLKMKMSMALCSLIVEATSTYSPLLALRIHEICRGMRLRHQKLRAENCPNFILSMINNPRVNPRAIWGIMNIGIYQRMPRGRMPPQLPAGSAVSDLRNGRSLTPKMADLLVRMTVAFAHCKTRPHRVVLRNVTQCLHYLRRHNAAHNHHITRAITHATINLGMQLDKAVPRARADWAVRMIRSVEGPEVAKTVEMIVHIWNRSICDKGRRSGNTLSVRPIE
ncbi:hypothetical protein EG329_004629 [Mollisiaceae sp. DMI_Dod_QoI]|nr:hypothetical protein EG329_004629 [Helotiales sp. DMI_Dod_QoI]